MKTFSEWAKLEETKGPKKKAKITPVAHTDIDRWLKSVDGLAKDLISLKKAKEKSQVKLDQIKKKYEPAEKPAEKPTVDKPAVEKPIDLKQKDEKEPDSEPVKVKLKPEDLNNEMRKKSEPPDVKRPTKRFPARRVPAKATPQQDIE